MDQSVTTLTQPLAAPTLEQQRVIKLSAQSTAVVVAGPGSGKTYTLLRRAARLFDSGGLDPSEVLVLSFTRAVVHELRRRGHEDASVRILPETFDSFASRLLREIDPSGEWAQLSFDRRIERATAMIRDGAARPTLERVRHVLIDEMQDLVGVRAAFVAALLSATAAGWTVFGDPAQAIYDHERGDDDSDPLLRRLRGTADDDLVLTGNHRTAGAVAEELANLGVLLAEGEPAAVEAVWNVYRDLPTAGEAQDLAALLHGVHGSFAVLCRDNATALRCSALLREHGVRHRVRRRAASRPVAGWVAPALRGRSTITREVLGERVTDLRDRGFPGVPSPDDAWRTLSRMDRSARTGAVRVAEVASRIGVGRTPWELTEEPEAPITLSSIHRAKGLEFDSCCVVEWEPRKDVDEALEARVLYVALSRARGDRFHAAALPSARWFRAEGVQGRFVKAGHQRWQTFGIEVLGDDVHGVDPAGVIITDVDSVRAQDLLRDEVRPGDSVMLEYCGEHDLAGTPVPCYSIHHAAGPIGATSDLFGKAMATRVRGDRRPGRITDVRVEDLETVKGPEDSSEAAGLGGFGLWLRPRLIGLGDFDWG